MKHERSCFLFFANCSTLYCKFGNFHEDFIFAKLRICEISWKENPGEMAKSLCRLLIYVNHAIVANFKRCKYVF